MFRTDAVVIGAGFAGLSAATALREAGLDVVVLEARNRVGGRVAAPVNALDERVDVGGQFFCEDMPEVTKLARAHGKTFVKPFTNGRSVARPPLVDGETPDRLWQQVAVLRERMNALDPADPAVRRLSVAEWLDSQSDSHDAKAAFCSMINGLWCIDPTKLPLSFLISNDRRVTNEVSEMQYFLAESMASLADDLAHGLGAALHLAEPVQAVEQGIDGVTVRTADDAYQARMAIIAVPPVRTREIRLVPEPPQKLSRALNAWGSGYAAKFMLRYAEPFWRAKGLSGTVTSRDPAGVYACEASVDAGHARLVVFVAGLTVLRWRAEGEADLQARVLAHLAETLGAEAATPIDATMRDWTDDRWSGGAYADLILDFNALDAEDVLREGWGPIQFASSELASSFPAYVEGAIVAGREAVKRLLPTNRIAAMAIS